MISKCTLRLTLSTLGMIIFAPALQAQAPPPVIQAPMPVAPTPKASDTSNADVTKAMVNYRAVMVRYRIGTGTSADVCQASIVLAEAHLRSDAPNTPNETISNLNLIASQRANLVRIATTGYQVGTSNFAEVKQANAALMEANTRISLYKAVTFQEGTDLKQAVDTAAMVLRNSQDLKRDGQKSVTNNDPK